MKLVYPFVLAVSVFCAPAGAFSNANHSLYTLDKSRTASSVGGMYVANTVEESAITLNVSLLAANPDAMEIVMLDGSALRVVRTRSIIRDQNHSAWFGKVYPVASRFEASQRSNDRAIGTAMFHRRVGRVSGIVHAYGAHFQIVPGSAGHRLVEVAGSSHHACGLSDVEGAPVEFGDSPSSTQHRGFSSIEKLDTMSLYTVDFLASPQLEEDAMDFIMVGAANANFVLAESRIDAVFELVHVGPITGEQPAGSVVSALRHLNDEDSTEIVNLRNTHGADMVSLLIPPNSDNPCGIANLPRIFNGRVQISDGVDFTDQAFMAHEFGCGAVDYTYVHEFGHSLGMWHDRGDPFQLDGDPIYDFSFGHLFDVQVDNEIETVASVMGCAGCALIEDPDERDACYDAAPPAVSVCDRIPHFSDPDIPYLGVPTGSAPAVGHGGSINAQVARNRISDYADFKPTNSDGIPVVQVLSPEDDQRFTIGDPIELIATAGDPEDGDLTSAIQWFSNRQGQIATGGTASVILNGGDHILTARVADSDGKIVEHSVRVSLFGAGAPEIVVSQAGEEIPAGGAFDFGALLLANLPTSHLFEICNTGNANLNIPNASSLVSGAGFTQIGATPTTPLAPNACTTFRVRFNVASAGSRTGLITIDNNDSNEDPYLISLSGEALDALPEVQLVAGYQPAMGATRAEYASSSPNPPVTVDFFFDPNQGSFEERPGGACADGSNNPSYLKIWVDSEDTIDSCTYQASWDANPHNCLPVHVQAANQSTQVILNVDDLTTNVSECELKVPFDAHVRYNEPHWFEVVLFIDGNAYTRRVNFRQRSQVSYLIPTDDTYVDETATMANFGSGPTLYLRGGAGNTRYAMLRYNFANLLGQPASATLDVAVKGHALSDLYLYDVCETSWLEGTLIWDNWEVETGGACDLLDSVTGVPAFSRVRFDVSPETSSGGVRAFGFATNDTGTNGQLGSSEGPVADQPRLIITRQR